MFISPVDKVRGRVHCKIPIFRRCGGCSANQRQLSLSLSKKKPKGAFGKFAHGYIGLAFLNAGSGSSIVILELDFRYGDFVDNRNSNGK